MKDLFAEALNNAATDSITETERNIVGQAGTHHKEIGGHTYMVVERSFGAKETVFSDTSKNEFLSIFLVSTTLTMISLFQSQSSQQ